ncbi:hypothetical protein OROGR_010099 [Orobanche gracilis]
MVFFRVSSYECHKIFDVPVVDIYREKLSNIETEGKALLFVLRTRHLLEHTKLRDFIVDWIGIKWDHSERQSHVIGVIGPHSLYRFVFKSQKEAAFVYDCVLDYFEREGLLEHAPESVGQPFFMFENIPIYVERPHIAISHLMM